MSLVTNVSIKKVKRLKYPINLEIELSSFIYPIEYIWIHADIVVITISITDVKGSNKKLQFTFKSPETIQLNIKYFSDSEIFKYLKKTIQDKIDEIEIKKELKIWEKI